MTGISAFMTMGLELAGGVASVSRAFVYAVAPGPQAEGASRVRVCGLYDRNSVVRPGYRYQHLGYGGKRLQFALRAMSEYVRPGSYVVFGHVALARTILFVPMRRPYAVWVYGDELRQMRSRTTVRWVLQRADKVIAISEWTRDEILRVCPRARGRVEIVHPCIDPDREATWLAAEEDAEEPEAGRQPPTALIVGTMSHTQAGKGHETLIRAWPDVRKRVPGARLIIAGGGEDRERLESLVGEGEVQGIAFVGKVGEAELWTLYRTADIFVMPSRQDGFGIVYAEALWHGLPCVASNSGGGPAAVQDGQTGLLVDPYNVEAVGDAVARLLEDGDLYATLSESGSRHARSHLTFSRFRRELRDVLSSERI